MVSARIVNRISFDSISESVVFRKSPMHYEFNEIVGPECGFPGLPGIFYNGQYQYRRETPRRVCKLSGSRVLQPVSAVW